MSENRFDRRAVWKPTPRPQWVTTLNDIGKGLDARTVLPLNAEELMAEVVRKTGLADFGKAGWEEHFRVLLHSLENEADLHFAGRLMTRAEMLMYLETRLQVADWYHRYPETEQEQVDAPVFITGFGRSGTTILFEVLAQDPQFRVVTKWESLFPAPAPEEATYATDPRKFRTEQFNALFENIAPEFQGLHKTGGDLPVESLEMEYATFLSEMYPIIFQVPSYSRYLEQHDLTSTFEWKRTMLKLLQSRFRRKHWLMKSPSHLVHLDKLQKVFPGIRFVFAHRDPLVSADSVVSFMGALYWLRSDNPWGASSPDDFWMMGEAQGRAKVWNGVIDMIRRGDIAKGNYANFYYQTFMEDPIAAVRKVYDDLGMALKPEVAARMTAFLDHKFQGKFGRHEYEKAPPETIAAERAVYQPYQDFFNVPSEI